MVKEDRELQFEIKGCLFMIDHVATLFKLAHYIPFRFNLVVTLLELIVLPICEQCIAGFIIASFFLRSR